jgi:hypothetical protein
MTEDTPNKARKAFWVITLIAFLLPSVAIISCAICFGHAAEIKHFPAHLFESGYNFFLVAVPGGLSNKTLGKLNQLCKRGRIAPPR